MGGGFIGVDIFFVLSGYLVTEVLLRDLDGPTGRIALGRFYARRVRRLLPAAVLTVLITAAVYGAVASPTAVAESVDSMRAALLYVANWYFIGQSTDYFAVGDASPVLHFWSLAVEEQFYVVWPLLLMGAWAVAGRGGRTGRDRRIAVAAMVGVAAIASFGGAMVLRGDSPTRAYFGTDTRAYQLLAGAGLALLPQVVTALRRHRAARALGPLGALAVLAVASGTLSLGPFERSAAATLAAIALILGVEAHPEGVVARALSLRTVVYLGTISYATYLWHWPVIVVARELGIATSAMTLAALAALLATALAALSSEVLELPIRRSAGLDRYRYQVIAAGLTVSAVAALVVLPPLLDPDRAAAGPTDVADAPVGPGTPLPESFSFEEILEEDFGEDLAVQCDDGPVSDCTVVDGAGPHVLLIGDSNATMYIPALVELAEAADLRLSLAATGACPWQVGAVAPGGELATRCREVRPDTYERLLPELDPDVILLVNHGMSDGEGERPDSEDSQRLQAATDASLDLLEATGARIVLLAPAPRPPLLRNPLDCLATAEIVEPCGFTAHTGPSWLDDQLQARAEASDAVDYLDFGPSICPRLPTCDAMLGDVVTFWDGLHITRRYSELLAHDLGRELAARGIIPVVPDPDEF